MICRACARSSSARRWALRSAGLALAVAGAGGRPLGVPRLVLLARDLGHLRFLHQAGLEQLLLQGVRFCHVSHYVIGSMLP